MLVVVAGTAGSRCRRATVAVAFDLFEDPFVLVALQTCLVGVLPDEARDEIFIGMSSQTHSGSIA